MMLDDWRAVSFSLSADLQSVAATARRRGAEGIAGQADELRRRVEERRFRVAVVGDFRRGKSTFINALLGREVLPSDIAPTTATVNRVTYGLKPIAELRFHDKRPPLVVSIEDLAGHVTKLSTDAAARAAEIEEAVISYPVRFCRNDVDILDTPGLGDEATMTSVTMRLLPTVDAAVLVIMADSPFSQTEADFLDRLLGEGLTEIFFVVSALDRIRRPADRERLIASIRERIAARIQQVAARHDVASGERAAFVDRYGSPAVHGCAALLALEGRAREDAASIQASGMPTLEVELERFLTRADEAGLARRVDQTAKLVRELANHLRASSARNSSNELDLELGRLSELLRRCDEVMDEVRRVRTDTLAAAAAALRHADLRADLSSAVTEVVLKQDVTDYWPARYDEFVVLAATRVREAALGVYRRELTNLAFQLSARLGTALASEGPAIEEAVRYVLAHVAEVQSGLRGVAPGPAWPGGGGPSLPTLDVAAAAEPMVPAGSAIVASLRDPSFLAALEAVKKRNALDAFFALDFVGVRAKWQSDAMPLVWECVSAPLASTPTRRAITDHIDATSRAWHLSDNPLRTGVHLAREQLVATRERAAALREREAADTDSVLRDLEALATRLVGLRAKLLRR